ncbi:Single-strand selective monofunctional uracil DNA glycosylase [Eumeta japonica]|uniref:Single-strand selective monofunctional uracil DNA glycosylase n=1 Tax=Eumeta variegata TaxID=151549 RepID=A0A4C1YU06_EUMVA|nr:Single-strand selective monofunctional uracil DNA glycosylase [Eumeta japonica]
MNPGPWGMSQTGVPFGDVNSVRSWLGIEGPVGKPPREASSRPVKGFNCGRSEMSDMQELYALCDPIFCKVLELYDVDIVIAIGKFCECRAIKAIARYLPSRDIKAIGMKEYQKVVDMSPSDGKSGFLQLLLWYAHFLRIIIIFGTKFLTAGLEEIGLLLRDKTEKNVIVKS